MHALVRRLLLRNHSIAPPNASPDRPLPPQQQHVLGSKAFHPTRGRASAVKDVCPNRIGGYHIDVGQLEGLATRGVTRSGSCGIAEASERHCRDKLGEDSTIARQGSSVVVLVREETAVEPEAGGRAPVEKGRNGLSVDAQLVCG